LAKIKLVERRVEMKTTVLHGFRNDGSFLIWVLDEDFGATHRIFVVQIYSAGFLVYERDVMVFREDVDNRNVGIGILEIRDALSVLKGNTVDLSIVLCVNQKLVSGPIPFVVPVTV
jgi:hypothetical protein